MRTLVAKEIRLLLPAFAGALALAIVPVWLEGYGPMHPWSDPNVTPAWLYLFGTLLLALSSYGREIGLKTIPFILAQPVERARIWRTKLAVLAVSVALVYDAWLTSSSFRYCLQPGLVIPPTILAFFGIISLVLIGSALWMTLLLRQIVAAFWLSILVPLGLVTAVEAFGGTPWIMAAAVLVYGIAALFLARRQFLHVQDTAWTGGLVAFGSRRAAVERAVLRQRRPWAALFWKEVQLQQVTLLGMAFLPVLQLGVIALRKAGAHTFGRTTLMALDAFGALWFVVPLLAGCQSVAEERKFGTMQAHLCLPISRRAQWFLKLLMTLVIGGLLGWALYGTMERVAGIAHGDFIIFPTDLIFFLLLALAGFYGSTLTGGVVQALAAAVLVPAGCWVCMVLPYLWQTNSRFQLCTGALPFFIGWPMLVATVLWLAFRNYGHATASPALWRRNALALAGMAALSFCLTVGIYHRAWEWLTPLEPAPGPARFSLEKPPVLQSYGGRGLAALLPDGRLWVDLLYYGQRRTFGEPSSLRSGLGRKPPAPDGSTPTWMSLSGNEFVPGSNWVAAAANLRETVAIRSDGTLWVSAKPRNYWDGRGPPVMEPSAGLIQFGDETNWLSVVRKPEWEMFLLKRDGTLWGWGDDSFKPRQAQIVLSSPTPPSLRDFEPRRLGHDSDWARLMGANGGIYAFAWKRDGSAWTLHNPTSFWGSKPKIPPQVLQSGNGVMDLPSLDHHRWRSLIVSDYYLAFAGVREDGTLWCWKHWDHVRPRPRKASSTIADPTNLSALVQIGKDSDWAELAGSPQKLVARKTDGSLWTWEAIRPMFRDPFNGPQRSPVRLDERSDWMALGLVDGHILSLAADGNLWSWPNPEPVGIFGDQAQLQLAASRKPALIENIFDAK